MIRLLAALFATMATTAHAEFVDVASEIGLLDDGVERGLAWGDYDGDGDWDLYVAILMGSDRLFRNDGGTSFTDVTAAAGLVDTSSAGAAAWLDYDGDGHLDLYVARVGRDALFRNQGDNTFRNAAVSAGLAIDGTSWSVIVSDDDLDGDVDVYVVRFGLPNRLLRNTGAGRFEVVSGVAEVADANGGTAAAWGDYDGDGDPDLFVANKESACRLLRNEGGGDYVDVTESTRGLGRLRGVGATWGDCDNDGDLDLFVTCNLLPNRLHRNDGSAGFANVTERAELGHPGAGRGPTWGDYDNDGDLDLFVSISDGPDQLYRNDGSCRFENVTDSYDLGDPGTGTTSVWADFDGDGDLDLTLSKMAQTLRLYENRLPGGNHWVTVQLESSPAVPGVASGIAPGALGARVTLFADSLRLSRENSAGGGGYQVQGPREVHFGLGDRSAVDSVRVDWPGGDTQIVTPVAVDQRLRVKDR